MQDRLARNPSHLALRGPHPAALAGTIREREVTNRTTTLVIGASRNSRFAVALALALMACGGGGGGKKTDTYARASDVQGECCQHLQGGARDQCLAGIVRVDDAEIARNETNQATYACVVQHFQCNPETGHPTPQSAQAQLECIQDLP